MVWTAVSAGVLPVKSSSCRINWVVFAALSYSDVSYRYGVIIQEAVQTELCLAPDCILRLVVGVFNIAISALFIYSFILNLKVILFTSYHQPVNAARAVTDSCWKVWRAFSSSITFGFCIAAMTPF